MPNGLTELARPKQWTRDLRWLPPETVEDLELVDGEPISTLGKKRPHAVGANQLHRWLSRAFGDDVVNMGAPIDVAPEDNRTNEPVPDLIVLRRESAEYTSNPGPADLLLVVEISDTSLGFDLTAKARLYARAGIPEFWVLDLNGRRLLVHRGPAQGKYRSVHAYAEDEAVAPLAAPRTALTIRDMLA